MGAARDLGLGVGRLAPGLNNAITDVPGVLVGHKTIVADGLATGVTAVLPHGGDLFRSKVRAAVEVINGFGKSAGLMQLAELGTIETPILLTNTFSVAPCVEALIRRAIAANPQIGRETGTVNPVVCECNDGGINDIQAMAVSRQDAEIALDAASAGPVEQGSIGAGAGMTSFGFKAGIGSASRTVKIGSRVFTLGALVLSNFGRAGDLILPDGRRADPKGLKSPESGSIIVILGTDIPLDDRQLNRVARRGGAGIARLGSFWGHGSGDIAIAFTTADPLPHVQSSPFNSIERLDDRYIDLVFEAAVEATAEAVLNALCAAKSTVGRNGRRFPALGDWLGERG
ncbi:P1 family peptidase [Mesorhizobium sp. LHD-90]|uniref:DmpA family aminopeptidase n=1 Tax=Mesorhizobium sp. LHD-90 TaxID=3071414 RepID=UPI0027E0D3DD|nr:P1 family peptidase [Mesorhizobium sp. LHD-90]MDQ6432831.1 P1 family peptidase [Mesorhizobium sp. LHD-90]